MWDLEIIGYECTQWGLVTWEADLWRSKPRLQGHLGIDRGDISYIDGLVQEKRSSSALAMELYLSCANLSIL